MTRCSRHFHQIIITVAERFLVAREAGDFYAAAAWCAPVLELQDLDGSWFVDRATL